MDVDAAKAQKAVDELRQNPPCTPTVSDPTEDYEDTQFNDPGEQFEETVVKTTYVNVVSTMTTDPDLAKTSDTVCSTCARPLRIYVNLCNAPVCVGCKIRAAPEVVRLNTRKHLLITDDDPMEQVTQTSPGRHYRQRREQRDSGGG